MLYWVLAVWIISALISCVLFTTFFVGHIESSMTPGYDVKWLKAEYEKELKMYWFVLLMCFVGGPFLMAAAISISLKEEFHLSDLRFNPFINFDKKSS